MRPKEGQDVCRDSTSVIWERASLRRAEVTGSKTPTKDPVKGGWGSEAWGELKNSIRRNSGKKGSETGANVLIRNDQEIGRWKQKGKVRVTDWGGLKNGRHYWILEGCNIQRIPYSHFRSLFKLPVPQKILPRPLKIQIKSHTSLYYSFQSNNHNSYQVSLIVQTYAFPEFTQWGIHIFLNLRDS